MRDDFIETPALPPDAIAWIVSDFQRESLEPSSTYQTATTTMAPDLLSRTTKSPSENYTYRSDKRPIKNIITTSLTKQLHIGKNYTTNGSTLDKSLNRTILSNETEIIDDADVRTAPSYTFYAPQKILQRSTFVLQMSRDVLEYLQDWLNVKYPLAKLGMINTHTYTKDLFQSIFKFYFTVFFIDFVALPSLDREMISSLGLITLQTAFLQNADAITTEQYHLSAIKISEAIIKQFFGGITSPKIWKHNWLWEGLIKYLGRLVLTPLNPQWPMEEMQLMHITTRAMDIDAIQGWDSILGGTSEDGKNDEFFIDKSAAVIAMLHVSMGDANFRGCLGTFLNSFKFQTAEPYDLWSICTKKVNNTKNIKEMMNLWTTLESFPLLTVSKVGSTVTISQKDFHPMEFQAILDDPYLLNFTTTSTSSTSTTPAPTKKKSTTKWIFPVNYVTNVANVSDALWFHNSDGNQLL